MKTDELPILIAKDNDNLIFINCALFEQKIQVVDNIEDALDHIREILEIWMEN